MNGIGDNGRGDYEGLNTLVIGAVASYVSYHVVDAFVVYQTSVLAENVSCQVRLAAWRQLLKVSPFSSHLSNGEADSKHPQTQYQLFERHPQGRLATRVEVDHFICIRKQQLTYQWMCSMVQMPSTPSYAFSSG